MNDICGIYRITNTVNGKSYIGLSRHCLYRFGQHKRALNRGTHSNCHLQAAWDVYGEDSFDFIIIEETTSDVLPLREIYWIDYYDSFRNGYNRSLGGDGTIDVIHSDDRNRQISEKLSGKKRPEISGGNAENAIGVVCINTGEHYDCCKSAAAALGINYGGVLRSCHLHCTVGDGLVFMTADEYESLNADEVASTIENAHSHKRLQHTSRRVTCLNTGECFVGAKDACEMYGIKSTSSIHNCCKGITQTAGKNKVGERLAWAYTDDLDDRCDNARSVQKRGSGRTIQQVRRLEDGTLYNSIGAAAKCLGICSTTLHNHLTRYGTYHTNKDNETITIVLAN